LHCIVNLELALTSAMALPKVWHLFGEDHLPYRLLVLSRMIDRETARLLQKQFGLSLADWRLLAIGSAMGPSTASEIGAAGEIDRAEISRAFRKLEEAGLMTRDPDPKHGKRKIISPTKKGQAFFRKVRDERRQYFRAIMGPLSPDERILMDACLEKMAQVVSP
jgi:DNA-binding MarR family transcriptional regulator